MAKIDRSLLVDGCIHSNKCGSAQWLKLTVRVDRIVVLLNERGRNQSAKPRAYLKMRVMSYKRIVKKVSKSSKADEVDNEGEIYESDRRKRQVCDGGENGMAWHGIAK